MTIVDLSNGNRLDQSRRALSATNLSFSTFFSPFLSLSQVARPFLIWWITGSSARKIHFGVGGIPYFSSPFIPPFPAPGGLQTLSPQSGRSRVRPLLIVLRFIHPTRNRPCRPSMGTSGTMRVTVVCSDRELRSRR